MKLRLILTNCFLLALAFLSAQSGSYRMLGIADPSNGHLRQTPDGGYLMSGSFAQGGQQAGMSVTKLNGQFEVEWSKVLQSAAGHLDYGIDAQPTPDGGYAVLGAYDIEPWNNPVLAKMDYCLIKLDDQGEISWSKRYGGHRTDLPYALEVTDQGDFLISGYASRGTDILGQPKPYLLKLDAQGEIIWSQLQQNFSFDITMALLAHPSFQMKAIMTQDGGTVYAVSTGQQGFIVKLDAGGQIVWQYRVPMGGSNMGGDAEALWGLATSGGFIADLIEHPDGHISLLANVFFFIAIGNGQQGDYVYVPVASVMDISAQGSIQQAQAFFHLSGNANNATDLYATSFTRLPTGNLLISGSIGGNRAFMMELDPALQQIDAASQWAESFGSMHISNYPYDYDYPRVSLSHQGDYLSFFDAMRIHQIDQGQAGTNDCGNPLAVKSFPFMPTLYQAQVQLDSLGQAIPVSYQSSSLSGIRDTTFCGLTTLSIHANEINSPRMDLFLYPSPTHNWLTMEWEDLYPGETVELKIRDMNGRLVYQQKHLASSAISISLEPLRLSPGVYLMEAKSGQKRSIGRFIKQ